MKLRRQFSVVRQVRPRLAELGRSLPRNAKVRAGLALVAGALAIFFLLGLSATLFAVCLLLILVIISRSMAVRRARAELRDRTRQQDAIIALGEVAVSEATLRELLNATAEKVAEALESPLAGVWLVRPDEGILILEAGHGWRPGLVGLAELSCLEQTQGGYVLASDLPVAIADIASEGRFVVWPELLAHRAAGGFMVRIPGDDGPSGLLGVFTAAKHRRFTLEEIRFVQSAANLIGQQQRSELALSALSESEGSYNRIVERSTDAFISIDAQSVIFEWNTAAEDMFGWEREDAIGRRLSDLIIPERYQAKHERGFASVLASGRGVMLDGPMELHGLHKDGHEIPVELTVWSQPVGNRDGVHAFVRDIAFHAFVRDISERRQFKDELAFMAYRDGLTDLPNRAFVMERLGEAIAARDHGGDGFCFLLLDIDGLARVNDWLGAETGDLLLQAVGHRLTRRLTDGVVARFEGDTFAVILPADTPVAADEAAHRVLELFAEPFSTADSTIELPVSIGLSRWKHEGDAAEQAKSAEIALAQAQREGGNRVVVAERELEREWRSRRQTEIDLAEAIPREQLRLEYQPIVDLRSGHIVGAEVLPRWHHPQRGVILPEEFVPLAESSGTILEIGAWVRRTACAQLRAWLDVLPELYRFSLRVNISDIELQQPDLSLSVARLLKEFKLDSWALEVEIGERAMRDDEDTRERLIELADLGVGVSIDDFGTGFSSLSALRSMPISTLKIDEAFIADMTEDAGAMALVQMTIELTKVLHLDSIAEGVESEQQFHALRRLGCSFGQGFHISPPVDATTLGGVLAREVEAALTWKDRRRKLQH